MKSLMYRIVLTIAFLALFNTVFFLSCGTDNPTSVWVSYGFIHLAYFTIVLLPVFSTKGEASFYLSSVLYTICIPYFILELIAGIACIIWAPADIMWPLIIQGVLWFLFIIVFLINAWANESTSKSLQQRQADMSPLTINRMDLKKMILLSSNNEVRTLIDACYERLSISNTRQTAESVEIDQQIQLMIFSMKETLRSGNDAEALPMAKRLKALVEERQAILKYSSR